MKPMCEPRPAPCSLCGAGPPRSPDAGRGRGPSASHPRPRRPPALSRVRAVPGAIWGPSSRFPQLSCGAPPRVPPWSAGSYVTKNCTSWGLRRRDRVPTPEQQGYVRAGLQGQGSPEGTTHKRPMDSPHSVRTPTRVRPHRVGAECPAGPVAVAGQPEGARTARVRGLPDHRGLGADCSPLLRPVSISGGAQACAGVAGTCPSPSLLRVNHSLLPIWR